MLDVLVVGAGPTGLTLAVELARRKIAFRILDQAPARSPHSRAIVVQARTVELFQKLDAAEDLVAAGRRTVEVSGFVNGRRVFDVERLGDIGAEDTPFPFVLFVSQYETERVLESVLSGLGPKVERPARLVALGQDPDGVTATLEGGETIRARYAVGCDGAHSAVRKAAGLSFEGAPYPQEFVLADVEVRWDLPHGRLRFFFARQGLMVYFPYKDGVSARLIATLPTAWEGFAGSEPALEEVEELARELSGLDLRLAAPRWLSRFRVHHRIVDSYRRGRIFVAGDAAHIHSPAGGQGMNTGIQDAFNLAWKLAAALRGQADDRFLDSYDAERRPVGRLLLERTDRLFQLASTSNRFLLAVRNFAIPRLLPRVLASAGARRRVFRFISQLAIRYSESPIVSEEGAWDHRRLHRGARAPDAPLPPAADAGSAGATIFEATRSPAHHLLVFGTAAETVAAARETDELRRAWDGGLEVHAVLPAAALANERYDVGPEGAVYLLRPDGYVGFRARGLGALKSRLKSSTWLRPPSRRPG